MTKTQAKSPENTNGTNLAPPHSVSKHPRPTKSKRTRGIRSIATILRVLMAVRSHVASGPRKFRSLEQVRVACGYCHSD